MEFLVLNIKLKLNLNRFSSVDLLTNSFVAFLELVFSIGTYLLHVLETSQLSTIQR